MGIPVLCSYSKMLFQEHFDVQSDMEVKVGDRVILSTRRGMEVGRVVAPPGTTKLKRTEGVAGNVLRRATREDTLQASAELIRVETGNILKTARRLVRELNLDMRFADYEETLDHAKVILYFTAENRIDFRELVRGLASALNKRIELRQIGARDVARLAGDVDICGEELCCKTFVVDFVPVSMKMAKNQGASLDNSKVSGICGRLKCCLKYEDDLYGEMRKTVPMHGQPCKVGEAEGFAVAVNILNQIITVQLNDGKREDHPVAEITFDPTMSERDIRDWQRDRRDRMMAEREQRMADQQARRDRRMSARNPRTASDTQEPPRSGAASAQPRQSQRTPDSRDRPDPNAASRDDAANAHDEEGPDALGAGGDDEGLSHEEGSSDFGRTDESQRNASQSGPQESDERRRHRSRRGPPVQQQQRTDSGSPPDKIPAVAPPLPPPSQ